MRNRFNGFTLTSLEGACPTSVWGEAENSPLSRGESRSDKNLIAKGLGCVESSETIKYSIYLNTFDTPRL